MLSSLESVDACSYHRREPVNADPDIGAIDMRCRGYISV